MIKRKIEDIVNDCCKGCSIGTIDATKLLFGVILFQNITEIIEINKNQDWVKQINARSQLFIGKLIHQKIIYKPGLNVILELAKTKLPELKDLFFGNPENNSYMINCMKRVVNHNISEPLNDESFSNGILFVIKILYNI